MIEYILRKITNETNEENPKNEMDDISRTIYVIQQDIQNVSIDNSIDEKYEWYEKWREDNL